MALLAYSADLKLAVIRDVLLADAPAEALAARHQLPVQIVCDWLAQAASALPTLFAGEAQSGLANQILRPECNYELVFQTSRDAIMLLTEAGFLDCNVSTLRMFGFESVEAFTRMHPADMSPPTQPCGRPSFDLANEHIRHAIATGGNHFEWTHRRRSGEDFEADVLLSCFEQGGRTFLQATVRDVSKVKRLQTALSASYSELARAHEEVEQRNQELATLCVTDQLTELFNRRKLDEVMKSEFQMARRYRNKVAIILADIDHFKQINDSIGHQAGDSVLRDVAMIMKRGLRETDVLGRWGGEEFMVVCRGSSAEQACVVAERARNAIECHGFTAVSAVTCSFGVAGIATAESIDAMIRQADSALYEAKTAGRNRVVMATR